MPQYKKEGIVLGIATIFVALLSGFTPYSPFSNWHPLLGATLTFILIIISGILYHFEFVSQKKKE